MCILRWSTRKCLKKRWLNNGITIRSYYPIFYRYIILLFFMFSKLLLFKLLFCSIIVYLISWCKCIGSIISWVVLLQLKISLAKCHIVLINIIIIVIIILITLDLLLVVLSLLITFILLVYIIKRFHRCSWWYICDFRWMQLCRFSWMLFEEMVVRHMSELTFLRLVVLKRHECWLFVTI